MSKVAFVYPGQGSQFVGMGRELAESSPELRAIFDKANEILGRDLTRIMFEGPEDELKQTLNTQPALLITSIAAHEALRAKCIKPAIVAGHSLGEYSALYAAGVLDLETALKLVKLRAELMQQAGTVAPGAMAAIMGMDDNALRELCASTNGDVVVANYNAPGQTVISGKTEAVSALLEKCKAAGAKRALPLLVSGAFHSPLMAPAGATMCAAIDAAVFAEPQVPVVSNVDGKAHTSAAEIRDNLKKQMTSSVMWTDTIQSFSDAGVTTVVEVGPGKVLAGLVKRINKELGSANAGTAAEVEQVSASLAG